MMTKEQLDEALRKAACAMIDMNCSTHHESARTDVCTRDNNDGIEIFVGTTCCQKFRFELMQSAMETLEREGYNTDAFWTLTNGHNLG